MFPVEKPSILENIARGASGQVLPPGTVGLSTLLDEKTIENISRTAGLKIWEHLVTFGSASAGIMAIIIIIRLLKLIIDTHRTIYYCGMHSTSQRCTTVDECTYRT